MSSIIRTLRTKAGLTQIELAKRANVAVRTIQNAESGLNISIRNRRKIIQGLGKSYVEDHGWIFPDDNVITIIVQANREQVDRYSTQDAEGLQELGKQVAHALKHDLIIQRLHEAYPNEEHILNEDRLHQLDLERQQPPAVD